MDRPRWAPSGGRRALLALAWGFLTTGVAVAQVLPFRTLVPDTRVTWSRIATAPRIAFAELPIDDRIAAANAIPDREARAMLDAALDAPAVDREAARAPPHAWARGEVGPKLAVALDSRALSTALLDDRNAAWARTLKARLAVTGTMLFAAGAGHFAGPRSVIARLQALGVEVERVE